MTVVKRLDNKVHDLKRIKIGYEVDRINRKYRFVGEQNDSCLVLHL